MTTKEATARRRELLRIRRALKLTPSRYAEALGVDLSSVCRWESGERNPREINVLFARRLLQDHAARIAVRRMMKGKGNG